MKRLLIVAGLALTALPAVSYAAPYDHDRVVAADWRHEREVRLHRVDRQIRVAQAHHDWRRVNALRAERAHLLRH